MLEPGHPGVAVDEPARIAPLRQGSRVPDPDPGIAGLDAAGAWRVVVEELGVAHPSSSSERSAPRKPSPQTFPSNRLVASLGILGQRGTTRKIG